MVESIIPISIIENSKIANIAAYKLKSKTCAIVFGKTVFLHGVSKQEFMADSSWLCHEIQHVMQWRKEGTILFFLKYIWYSLRYGYYNNPFEIEARHAEQNLALLEKVHVIQ